MARGQGDPSHSLTEICRLQRIDPIIIMQSTCVHIFGIKRTSKSQMFITLAVHHPSWSRGLKTRYGPLCDDAKISKS